MYCITYCFLIFHTDNNCDSLNGTSFYLRPSTCIQPFLRDVTYQTAIDWCRGLQANLWSNSSVTAAYLISNYADLSNSKWNNMLIKCSYSGLPKLKIYASIYIYILAFNPPQLPLLITVNKLITFNKFIMINMLITVKRVITVKRRITVNKRRH